jgi:hypothetical protein
MKKFVKENAPLLIFFILYVLLQAPYIFNGYGYDNDGWTVAKCGQEILKHGTYVPSRPPGFLFFEFSIGALSLIGGWIVSNSATLFMALGAMFVLYKITENMKVGRTERTILTAALGLFPIYFSTAGISIDFVWGLFFVLASFYWAGERKFAAAGIMTALAIGCRLSNVLFLIPAGYIAWRTERSTVKLLPLFVFGLLGGAAFYVIQFMREGVAFAHVYDPYYSHVGILVRTVSAIYKLIFVFFNPVAFAGLIAVFIINARKIFSPANLKDKYVMAAILAGLLTLVLYWRLPHDHGYLLPLVPFSLIIVARSSRRSLIALLVVFIIADLFTIDIFDRLDNKLKFSILPGVPATAYVKGREYLDFPGKIQKMDFRRHSAVFYSSFESGWLMELAPGYAAAAARLQKDDIGLFNIEGMPGEKFVALMKESKKQGRTVYVEKRVIGYVQRWFDYDAAQIADKVFLFN